jgi:hypothetical protein
VNRQKVCFLLNGCLSWALTVIIESLRGAVSADVLCEQVINVTGGGSEVWNWQSPEVSRASGIVLMADLPTEAFTPFIFLRQ